jgi:dTDP-4-dehydrorhamnose 3,5-epimerase
MDALASAEPLRREVVGVAVMLFSETDVAGAFVIDIEPIKDERGFFGRTWCRTEFARRGLSDTIVQVNTAVSVRKGTLRGVHYQLAPHAEVKIVQCTRGSVYDVAVDLRPASPTFRRWAAVELSGHNYRAFYIPEGCAHGYLTLADDVVLTYSTSAAYAAQHARGVRFDDPAFGIQWPGQVQVISAADRGWPNFFYSSEDKP